jgi:hypothetical protein
MAKKIDDDILDELLRGCERPEDLLGDGGLMRDLKKALMQRMLGAELTEHLGYEHGQEAPPVQTNRRNGVSRKTMRSEDGTLEIEVPRDREGSFEPRLIAKGQTRIDGLDDKIIALYARGMSVRDIPRPSRGALRARGLARPDQPGDRRRARRGEGMALAVKGEIVSGVVYDPAKDEMFYAEKGQGAWLNDSQRLRVSGRKVMIESIFATGIPFGGKRDLPDTLKDLARLMPACAGVRRWGSAALDLAYVAAGRYEGYWERGLKPWDMAAGLLVVREAGGLVEAVVPGEDPLLAGTILAANGLIFETFAKVIRNV